MSHQDHIIPHRHQITVADRVARFGHRPYLLWFVGLSGSGKSTIASLVEGLFFEEGLHTYILDGDNVRSGLNKGLSFSDEDRKENIRRIAEVGKLFLDAGVFTITAFISPFAEDRRQARQIIGGNQFIEVFVDTPIEVCEERDVKGLYKKARSGEIKHFTGLDSPFEVPEKPDIHLKTAGKSPEQSATELYNKIKSLIKNHGS